MNEDSKVSNVQNTNGTTVVEDRPPLSGAKSFINIVLSIVILVGVILTSFFLFGGISMQHLSLTALMPRIILGILTFAFSICLSNVTEERLKRTDPIIHDRTNKLNLHANDTLEEGRGALLQEYVNNVNKNNKYKAYIYSKKKQYETLGKLQNIKFIQKRRDLIKQQLLLSSDDVWVLPKHIKYHKITDTQLLNGSSIISSKECGDDLELHRITEFVKKFLFKMVLLVSGSGVAVDLVYSTITFDQSQILPLLYKIATLIAAGYTGVSMGCYFTSKYRRILRSKLIRYSDFEQRMSSTETDNHIKLRVTPELDPFVESIRTELRTVIPAEVIQVSQAHVDEVKSWNKEGTF